MNTLANNQKKKHIRQDFFTLAFLFLFIIFLVGLFSCNATADSGESESSEYKFSISKATWDADKSRLKVKGKGVKGLSVTLSNANSSTILGEKRIEGKKWKFKIKNLQIVPCRIKVTQSNGVVLELDVKHAPSDCDGTSPPPPPPSLSGQFRVLAANDLGMHCADKDYQIFSILPPFNVIHAQTIQKGTGASLPSILANTDINMHYAASSNPNDPVWPNSINTNSKNALGIFKSNFWDIAPGTNRTYGGLTYERLYPATILALFEPIPVNLGIPVPDIASLPQLVAEQQAMPGIINPYNTNDPQDFLRFDKDVHFFGNIIPNVNWFAADGVPITPVDDMGKSNAYPLMKVSATSKSTGKLLDSVDVVLPVASEADCQNCHADPNDWGNGAATTFASVNFDVVSEANAPGPEQLGNAAKMNILRLHDAKHGATYTSSVDGSLTVCDPVANPNDPNCLANQTPIQCAQCHYTPALDLTQQGPQNETTQGARGRQQKRHISMSRAMHYSHSNFKDPFGNPAFPTMPQADDPRRTGGGVAINAFEQGILEETCYQCHPGKNTQCLRGAMFSGGVICQDCHGSLKQVGDDYSDTSPHTLAGVTKRIPWATEPKCQSCHTGDALTPNHPAGGIVAKDGIRLAQAYLKGDITATPIVEMASRFAENQKLYRLSGNDDGTKKGHGGIMCEGCHGSTHGIWPNANPFANDNVTANQIQGHTGAITECFSCHATGTLGNTLDGPHGMHPVGGTRFADGGHEKLAEQQSDSCRSCHGVNGQGTVLSKVATDRSFTIDECDKGSLCSNGKIKNFTVNLKKGDEVSCTLCHKNKL